MGDTQRCGRCKQTVPMESFSPSYRGKTGTWCRPCFAAYNRGETLPHVPHAPQTCVICGKLYVPKILRPTAAFCSQRCKSKSVSALRAKRDQRIRREYGITLDEFEEMLERQEHRCMICRVEKPAGRWDAWHIDHCHTKGHVRGILCSQCNHGLGQFRDDPALLRRAAEYLEATASV